MQYTTGYNGPFYDGQFGTCQPILLLGRGLEPRVKFDPVTKRPDPNGEIESKRAWLYYPGLGVQTLKLPADFHLPKVIKDLAEVELLSPEACVVHGKVYVRAEGIKPA